MKFKWTKQGKVFTPKGNYDWMNSHAQVPFSLEFDNRLRVYFSTREKIDLKGQFKSHSGYVDLNKNNLSEVIEVSEKPIINLGGPGEFDEFGSMAGSVVFHNKKYILYYCGWSRCHTVPYNWSIGIAESEDGKFFRKLGKGPILGPTLNEPFLQACPIVYKISDDEWHMFYLSGIKWFEYKGKKESQYVLMKAHSKDGINWNRNAKPLLKNNLENECQTSASIFFMNGKYHMFFSYRNGTGFREISSRGYRIGYAFSDDLTNWERNDNYANIDVSEDGWDSKMVAYPHIFKFKNKLNMLYCGNDFGKGGFGLATFEY